MKEMHYCTWGNCGAGSDNKEWMMRHVSNHLESAEREANLRTELQADLEAYKTRVEQEFAEGVSSLFDMVIAEREKDMARLKREGKDPDAHRWARGQAEAYRQARASLRVMADLDPDT